jgi:Mlc titration factor MtfA (ptsG expression regulator)
MPSLLNWIFKRNRQAPDTGGGAVPTLILSDVEELEYTAIISRYIPFYHLLNNDEKKIFIYRTANFRRNKNFQYIGINEQPEIPILVSAAAVQLTFGLKRYLLDYYKEIYILPDAYQDNNTGPLFVGHVYKAGIYLSWKHFLQGYTDATDNVNVAIHEMAHAVAYDNFLANSGIDWEFREDFSKFPAVYGPAIAGMVVNRRCFLRPYAYTNIQEFWAVSVEAFFENPVMLKDNMPHLYTVIAEILNQDLQARHRIITTV